MHTERDSTKIITSSHIFDLKLSSPKFVHISSSDATGANYLYFFTETSSAGDLASFVGFTCNGGGASNLIKIPLKCSREDFVFAKMKQVVETDSMFHVLFETPFNLYKKTTICSYSFQNDFLPGINKDVFDNSIQRFETNFTLKIIKKLSRTQWIYLPHQNFQHKKPSSYRIIFRNANEIGMVDISEIK